MAKIKFGLIGCGQIARCNHVPEINGIGKDSAEIVALYDIKKGKAEEFAKDMGLQAKICKSEKEILAEDLDAIIIATPNCFHYPQTIAALNAGKHVLVEKPMASRVEDADEMIDLAEKKGLILQVNQSLRFIPLYAEIKKRVAAGAIGKPMHVRCLRAATSSPDVGWSKGATWFVQKKYEGSLVTDIAVHMADAMQWYFGPVAGIQAVNRCLDHEVPDNVNVLFDYANGATGVLQLSWTFPVGGGALELYGDEGMLRTTDSGFEIVRVKPQKETIVVNGGDIPVPINSHELFVERLNGKVTEDKPWEIGRSALALCCAINEASEKQALAVPCNRVEKTSVKKVSCKKAAAQKAPAKKAASKAKK